MDKKYLDYFMEHFYKEDLPPRELVGAAALFERMYTNTAQLLIGENNENSCSFCGAKWTIKSDGNLVWPPSNRKISIYCPMCGRHFVTKNLVDIMKEEKLDKLRSQLSTAGDRRDWDACEYIEKEIDDILKEEAEFHCGVEESSES